MSQDNVIGPINRDRWNTMLFLKQSLKVLPTKNENGKFDKLIAKDRELYKRYLTYS